MPACALMSAMYQVHSNHTFFVHHHLIDLLVATRCSDNQPTCRSVISWTVHRTATCSVIFLLAALIYSFHVTGRFCSISCPKYHSMHWRILLKEKKKKESTTLSAHPSHPPTTTASQDSPPLTRIIALRISCLNPRIPTLLSTSKQGKYYYYYY